MKNKLTITACLIMSLQFSCLLAQAEDNTAVSVKSEIDQMLNEESSSARSPGSETRAIFVEARAKNPVVRNPIKMNPLKIDDELEFKKDNSR